MISLTENRFIDAFFKMTASLASIDAKTTGSSGGGSQFPLDKYTVADTDQTSPNYFGLVDKDGNWVIIKQVTTGSADNFGYCVGLAASVYATNWTNRATLTYVTPDVAF